MLSQHKINIGPASFIMSPLCTQRWEHVGLTMYAQCFCCVVWVCVSHLFLLTQLLTQFCASISPVISYCVVFGATLNVGLRHRQQANITPALVQSIMPVPPTCRYLQHEVLTRAEWILARTGDTSSTFNRDWVSVGLYLPPAVSIAKEVI